MVSAVTNFIVIERKTYMKKVRNVFGEGVLYEAQDLGGVIYSTCAACMSIYAEFLSWANKNEDRFTQYPGDAESIVVLSCQVTDLAVLNDLRCVERLTETYPGCDYYIGGCLARRFDIDLPPNVRRLDSVKSDYTYIGQTRMVNYEPPFWVKDFNELHGEGSWAEAMDLNAKIVVQMTQEVREIQPDLFQSSE